MTLFHTLLISLIVFSVQTDPIEGTWVTQDDETGKQKSEVLIYKEDGKLYGKITKLLLPEDQGKKCVNCKGANKDQPIEGMIIIKDLELEDDTWEEGTILDPKSGKVYDCYVDFEDTNTLKVRGFLGFSLLGRTQIWKRK
ncbi:MAG: DUF2147 domain-containing protein [Flavobacteriaceae bacterium]|nr:DUF2147 domain-containing protein [Flavobacteriaceae bacterium]MDG2386146.1 DUF2147 domain-containing protein [Flavobacteriaceae bacterium]